MTPVGRRRGLTAALSVAGHAAAVWALISGQPDAAPPPEPAPVTVALVTMWRPPPLPPPVPPILETPAPPARAKARPALAKPPPSVIARRTPAPRETVVLPTGPPGPSREDGEISDGLLAGAAGAGSGAGSGQGCNMPGRLQRALRQDRLVQAAVARVDRGRALRVWNGDWVRHAGQQGAGLAAVREAILWEVAFAPEACRTEPMRGLIVLSLADGPGAARLVVGAGVWRWKDVLASRSGRATPR